MGSARSKRGGEGIAPATTGSGCSPLSPS
ncbi:uncharacterized protein G2W53_004861 [Senna tora]|uniref:Uncharacterized protein n=1 Tax=Senna tora TaxID=362788 RepID=A0A834XG11_9FABA|nr:uncharacterized protein G2W53_004861 [Senna tora]